MTVPFAKLDTRHLDVRGIASNAQRLRGKLTVAGVVCDHRYHNRVIPIGPTGPCVVR